MAGFRDWSTTPGRAMDWVEPNVCVDEHMSLDEPEPEEGAVSAQRWYLGMMPWSVPQLRIDVLGRSGGDGKINSPFLTLPGKLMIDLRGTFVNDTPVDAHVLMRITRGPKRWSVSNPNAVQFRDRWTFAVDREPPEPITSGVFNSQCGSAIDFGTNSVAEPNPGVQWMWAGSTSQDEWAGPISSGQSFSIWYRCYVWNPPPWSNNSNKNAPDHSAHSLYSRVQVISFPDQGTLVSG